MKTEDNELTEGTVLPDGRVARFEQLLDEKSELELTETMATQPRRMVLMRAFILTLSETQNIICRNNGKCWIFRYQSLE